MTTTRPVNHQKAVPQILQALGQVHPVIDTHGLDRTIHHLVQLRASQINGCAFCIDMHVKEGRKAGLTEQRLHLIVAWRESLLYSPRERAALAWAEALTLIAETRAPDADYEALKAEFTDEEMVKLSVAIGLIPASL